MFQCSNVPMFQCSNVPMFQYSNIPMFQCSNVPMFQCSNVPIFQCSNVPGQPDLHRGEILPQKLRPLPRHRPSGTTLHTVTHYILQTLHTVTHYILQTLHTVTHYILQTLHTFCIHCTHCTALHCTALHCTALHCTALHTRVTPHNIFMQNFSFSFAIFLQILKFWAISEIFPLCHFLK